MTSSPTSSKADEGGLKPFRVEMTEVCGTCDIHGEWKRPVMRMVADKLKGKCPECEKIAEQQKAEAEQRALIGHRKSRKEKNLSRLLEDAEIPRRFRGRSFDNYNATGKEQETVKLRMERYAKNFPAAMERGASMMLLGVPGTGKTHLACSVGNYVINNFGCSVRFVTVFDAIQRVKETYGDNGASERQVMMSFAEPDLLILDEVGVQYGTNFEVVVITDIINRRYSDGKPTIIMSNLTREQIVEYLGSRVVDRMDEGGGGVVVFNWESYRAKVLKDDNLPRGEFRLPDWMKDE